MRRWEEGEREEREGRNNGRRGTNEMKPTPP